LLRALLRFQNPDSTQDLNDQTKDLFNKGIFFGGNVEAITATLTVRVTPFASIGPDGMFVREDDDDTVLAVEANERNFIVSRQRYVENDDPIISVESLTEAEFLGDPEIDFLVVFAIVDVPALATSVTASMIEFFERDEIDPLGRLNFRGRLTNTGDLPPGSTNANRPGDFYIITDGTGGFPELFSWNGLDWVNITQAQTLISLLDTHRDNLDIDRVHVTNLQAEAILGTVGTPSDSNRFVTSLDPRLPNQNENDALQGDQRTRQVTGGFLTEEAPSDANRYVTAEKIFATPAEKSFTGLALMELPDAEGPYFVGIGGLGTAQLYFNIYSAGAGQDDDDQELLNLEFQPVRITGIFTEASFSIELNPATSSNVDPLGFWSGGSLFIQTDNSPGAGQDFTIGHAKRTVLGDLLPEAFINRGPQFGQVDARVVQLLSGSVNAQFSDSLWTSPTNPAPGEVVGFNAGTGKFVKHDKLFTANTPVGVRGNANNLIMEGLYEFSSPQPFVAGDEVYASESFDGVLTISVNEWFIGTFITDSLLLVNMNAFGISASTFVPGVKFSAGDFVGVSAGEVVGFDVSTGNLVQADITPAGLAADLEPVGLRGNSNNLIMEGSFTPIAGSPYTVGARLYQDDVTPGLLDPVKNDWYIARAVETNRILVNVNHVPIWEDSRETFEVEHFISTGTPGRHKQGSGRTFVGFDGDQIAASQTDDAFTGAVFFALDTRRVYYCEDGASNLWRQQEIFSGPLEIEDALTVGGNLILPTGILSVDGIGTDDFDIFNHAARHGAAGSDPISGSIIAIGVDACTDLGTLPAPAYVPGPVSVAPAPAAGSTIASIPIDFTGRSGKT